LASPRKGFFCILASACVRTHTHTHTRAHARLAKTTAVAAAARSHAANARDRHTTHTSKPKQTGAGGATTTSPAPTLGCRLGLRISARTTGGLDCGHLYRRAKLLHKDTRHTHGMAHTQTHKAACIFLSPTESERARERASFHTHVRAHARALSPPTPLGTGRSCR
jgi:anti-sigma factor RsiW